MSAGVCYILNKAGQPVRCNDLAIWEMWMADKERRMVNHAQVGNFLVSTAFIGVTASYTDDGKPMLWETLVRKIWTGTNGLLCETDGKVTRCAGTREQAEAQHREICKHLFFYGDLK